MGEGREGDLQSVRGVKRQGECDRTDCDSKLYRLLGTTGVTSMANGAKGKEGITLCSKCIEESTQYITTINV